MKTKKMFKEIESWGDVRGLKGTEPDVQFYRLLEEIAELSKALVTKDTPEIKDAIGDSVVVLTQLAKDFGGIENCISGAFREIQYRKGLNKKGSFVRYAKLSHEDQNLCDTLQGNQGSEFFNPPEVDDLPLGPEDFKA